MRDHIERIMKRVTKSDGTQGDDVSNDVAMSDFSQRAGGRTPPCLCSLSPRADFQDFPGDPSLSAVDNAPSRWTEGIPRPIPMAVRVCQCDDDECGGTCAGSRRG